MSSALVEQEAPTVRTDARHRFNDVSRYFPQLNPGDRVLDVGSARENNGLRQALPKEALVYSINIPTEPHGRVPDVWADASILPFEDNSFPLVVATDVIEHISPTKDKYRSLGADAADGRRLTPEGARFFYTFDSNREKAVHEMLRVASKRVAITVPFDSKNNRRHENALVDHMRDKRMEPKRSIYEHRMSGLPQLGELVKIGRLLRVPFDLYPSTVATTLFQSLRDQATVLSMVKGKKGEKVALAIAEDAELSLEKSSQPNWENAYRANLILFKDKGGRIVTDEDELFLSRNEVMAYQAALREGGWAQFWKNRMRKRYMQSDSPTLRDADQENILKFAKENPLRGRHIVIEGPEGSGKTSLVKELSRRLSSGFGYDVSIQTNHGIRQAMRDIEKKNGRVMTDPERAEFFAFAMLESTVSGNAFTQRGPCYVSVDDRGIESVRMHHGWHCPDNLTLPYLLNKDDTLSMPPDLTIVLRVPDPEHNFALMQKDGDMNNAMKGRDALEYQRKFYENLVRNGGSRYTGPIVNIENPGNEGTFEEVVDSAMKAIEQYCKIPTSSFSESITSIAK